jgi:hypothetical protein
LILDGKRILIIGSAKESEMEFNDVDLNTIDLIIRMNNSINFPLYTKAESRSNRIDILACSTYKKRVVEIIEWSKERFKQAGVSAILLVPHALLEENMIDYLKKNSIDVFSIPPKCYQTTLGKLDGSIPTTGFATLDFLFTQNLESLQIIGFSFFKTKYIEGYNNIIYSELEYILQNNNHNPILEMSITRQLIENCNYRVILGKDTFNALYA